jgi:hypothetical protein
MILPARYIWFTFTLSQFLLLGSQVKEPMLTPRCTPDLDGPIHSDSVRMRGKSLVVYLEFGYSSDSGPILSKDGTYIMITHF